MNLTAELPLSDGTVCRITERAQRLLEHEFDIRSGRIKKNGRGSQTVMVQPRAPKYRTAAEVALKDLLAVFCYGMGEDAEPGASWVLLDGDPRNLLPGNIAASKEPEYESMPEPESKAQPRETEMSASSLSVEQQLELLSKAISGHSYVTPDGETKVAKPLITIGVAILRNHVVAEEALGAVVLNIVEQIHDGAFRGESEGQFYAWVREIVRRQFGARLRQVSDVEPDRAAIRLRNIMQHEVLEAGSPHLVSQSLSYSSRRADTARAIKRAERQANKELVAA